MTRRNNWQHLRNLLTERFSKEELICLCYDHFPPVYHHLRPDPGKAHVVNRLITYADQNFQLDTLLALAQRDQPAGSAADQPAEDLAPGATSGGGIAEKSPNVQFRAFSLIVGTVIGMVTMMMAMTGLQVLATLSPTPTFPPPQILVERLEIPFSSPDTWPSDKTQIGVPPRTHTTGRTEFIRGYERRLWVFVCRRADWECQALPLLLNTEGEWDRFLDIGRPGSEDECALFEVGFAVVDTQTHLELSLSQPMIPYYQLPHDRFLDVQWLEVKRKLNADHQPISCEPMISS